MNTVKAEKEFTRRCKAVLTAKSQMEYYILAAEARSYGQAIKDICGGNIWLDIIELAVYALPEGTNTIAGIPTQYNFKPETAMP